MSFGQEFASGLRAGQSLFEPLLERKRQEQQLQQQIAMQQLKDEAALKQFQAQRDLTKQDNLLANKATLDILQAQGFQLPETVGDEQLQSLTPAQLTAVADDWSKRNKENRELERKQKGATALYNALPESLKKSITADDVVNLDPSVLNSLMNQELNRSQRDAAREDTQAFRQSLFGQQFENQKMLKQMAFNNQKQLKQFASSLKASAKNGKKSGSSSAKSIKRYNEETDSYDFYDPTTGQKVGQKPQTQKDLYAPININYTPRR